MLKIASAIWRMIAPFTKFREMPISTIALFVASFLILVGASFFMAREWLIWAFSWIYWLATTILVLAGFGLYSYGVSERSAKWTGRGLMCLNGPLVLGAVAGILVIIGLATGSLDNETLSRLYRDETLIFAGYTVLLTIHLVIQAYRPSEAKVEQAESAAAD